MGAPRRFRARLPRGLASDDFSPKGQDWAFPPLHSTRQRDSGYHRFIESIRKSARHGGALRIDQVMRFFRLYWIPDGVDAAHGAYVRYHAADLIRILALESVRQRFVVIGEDLGTVEPEVRETRNQFGVLSYQASLLRRDARRISQIGGISRAGAGFRHHARPSDARRILVRRRHRGPPPRGVLPDEASYRDRLVARAAESKNC
jgi:4-alpha-glucanotransferase